MIRQYELVEIVKAYDPDADEDAINRAYVYAMKMHGSQMRASGDPYFSHPLEVAGILTEMKLDTASVITALLHDTIEDTEATAEDIKRLFGDEVLRLVEGVTKLTRIEFQNAEAKQAENFRKLVLAMSEDIRVLLVKLADRLHNMRTLHHIKKPEKRKRIALETLEIYVPLAERVGVNKIKNELEDIAFQNLNPDAYDSITTRLKFLREEGESVVTDILKELREKLGEADLEVNVTGREKSPYSIWKKMQKKNISFEQLSDIMAFRVLTEDKALCYHVLGVIHSIYPTVPGRFKDYISISKPNGYQSLHTTVIGPENYRIEIQIRTFEMHEEAELGVAAHWAYKQGGGKQQSIDGKKYRWLRELMDIVEHAPRPEEFLEHTKLELFQEQVFCFTPQGDLIELPSGATPVDFAYAVHSKVGDTCVGAKVNGRIVPLSTKLGNGDQVDITTSKSQTPSPNWERFVVTGKARARIRRFIRSQQIEQFAELGKSMLHKAFKNEDKNVTDKQLAKVSKQFKSDGVDDLYAGIGSGHIQPKEVFKAVYPEHKSKPALKEDFLGERKKTKSRSGKAKPMPIKGLIPGMALHFARCCHPLPGDRIVGIVTTGKGVAIHTVDCDTLESFADTPERWLDVAWEDEDTDVEAETHIGRLNITLSNEPGSLGNLSTVVGTNGGNITNIRITNRALDFWEMLIDVYVKDSRHLSDIIASLRSNSGIISVNRAQSK